MQREVSTFRKTTLVGVTFTFASLPFRDGGGLYEYGPAFPRSVWDGRRLDKADGRTGGTDNGTDERTEP